MERAGELKDIVNAPGLSQQGICTTKEIQGCNPILHSHGGNHEDMKHRLASYCHCELEKTSCPSPVTRRIFLIRFFFRFTLYF